MLNSRYASYLRAAESRVIPYVKKPWKAARLVSQAARKAQGERTTFGENWQRFKALIRMLRAWAAGTYRQVPKRSAVFGLAALIYFVSPIDAIADFIPVIGLLDDVTVLAFVLNAIAHDLDDFRAWEESSARIIDAEHPQSAGL